MSAMTRSRIPTGSMTCPVSCGPSSLMTSMWIEFLRSANGSLVGAATAGLVVTRRSWSSMRYFLLKRNRDRDWPPPRTGSGCREGGLAAVRNR